MYLRKYWIWYHQPAAGQLADQVRIDPIIIGMDAHPANLEALANLKLHHYDTPNALWGAFGVGDDRRQLLTNTAVFIPPVLPAWRRVGISKQQARQARNNPTGFMATLTGKA